MPYIGAYLVQNISGPIQLSGVTLREINRPGVDGSDYQDIGIRGDVFSISSEADFLTANLRSAAKIAYAYLQGTVISVTDNRGIVWTNLLVVKTATEEEKYLAHATGGLVAGSYWMRTRWDLQPLATSYG